MTRCLRGRHAHAEAVHAEEDASRSSTAISDRDRVCYALSQLFQFTRRSSLAREREGRRSRVVVATGRRHTHRRWFGRCAPPRRPR